MPYFRLLGGGLTFVIGRPICLRIVASSGIPGIGVLPGVKPFLNCSELGMPGMGLLPIGILTAFTEIPGGKFAEGGNALAESPGGIFAGSSFISLFARVLELEFDGVFDPQPKQKMAANMIKIVFLNIL